MALDYEKIRKDIINDGYNQKTVDIAKIFVGDMYAKRTHFIFEMLQNAEDAIARRGAKWAGPRAVSFHLAEKHFRISHYGVPFNEKDVRGICGIGESTKTDSPNEIGRFGLGFKSVYAFTNRPEIHSGPEDFAINSFVWPEEVPSIQDKDPDQTVFILPFKSGDESGCEDIAEGLQKLEAKTLLFLRRIDEIRWSVKDGQSGQYLRKSKEIDTHIRSVRIISNKDEEIKIEEWLVFSHPVTSNGLQAGDVEIAFFQDLDEQSKCQRIQRVEHSPLVAFLPTAVETKLGFFVQGPYRTTTNRENLSAEHEEWNKHLVRETASLLMESLRWLRDQNRLDTTVLRCLPLESGQSLFAPLFDTTKKALLSEPLLSRADEGYIPASHALLGRTGELHNLFSPDQLLELYERQGELAWLSSEITADREPVLRQYLMQELNVPEVTPESIIQKLNRTFLEAQTDDWIQKFYEFLNGRPALRRRLADIPVIRLENGSHVTPKMDGQPQAFLPSKNKTGFPTVCSSVCVTKDALSFLKSLELEEPNPIDDIILNVLPKYRKDNIDITDADYADDIERMLDAYNTDSKKQQDKLIEELKKTKFVRSVDSGNGSKGWSTPGDMYWPTERLKHLFDSIEAVFFIDDSYACLKGERLRGMIEACGAVRYLRLIPLIYYNKDLDIWGEELSQLRKQAGHAETSGDRDRRLDYKCPELNSLLNSLSTLTVEERRTKARLLWEELMQLEDRRGKTIFGEYAWHHYNPYSIACDATFVRLLNNSKWVPDTEGNLQRPESILFDSLGWETDPFLESKIRFKPPVIDQLAKKAGIEPGVLDKIKELGITEEDLAEWGARRESEEIPDPDDIDSPLPDNPRRRRISIHRSQSIDPINHEERMEVEEKAIKFILAREPDWQRTPTNNPGYDLYKIDEQDQQTHWCEIKSISGSLADQPVGLSSTQFEYAQKYGEAYWLYVVEHADNEDQSNIIRIQNPAHKVRELTSDSVELDVQRDRSSLLLQVRFKSTWRNIAT